jgi:hypothetical protein
VRGVPTQGPSAVKLGLEDARRLSARVWPEKGGRPWRAARSTYGRCGMSVSQVELAKLPPEMQTLLDRVPPEYMHDLALDLAWAALVAPRRPDALYQVIREWEATLDEIDLAGDDLPEILRAREEVRSGIGMTPDELRTYLEDEDDGQ